MAPQLTLENYFAGAAGKILRPVEADRGASNQHELNGVKALTTLLGEPPADGTRIKYAISYVYLVDESPPLVSESWGTWYESRAKDPQRSEFRLYFPDVEVMTKAQAGDLLVIAKTRQGQRKDLVVLVAAGGSSYAQQAEVLFGLEVSERFDVEDAPSDTALSYTSRLLLEVLGYDVDVADDSLLDLVLSKFDSGFPQTREFSAFARGTLPEVDARADPDEALLAWWEREEVLFRTYERHLLASQFADANYEVDELLKLAMSAFQRRKSRAGHALENHVAAVLNAWGVSFDAQPRTEGKVRPDFLVPGEHAYRDSGYDPARLRLLAVKSTCKDRWRQILSEAIRIPRKHLLTLESPISANQTAEMVANSVELVVPRPLHDAYLPTQRLWTVAEMLEDFAAIE